MRALILLALVGCTAPLPSTGAGGRGEAPAGAEPAKTITIAQLNAVKSYGPWDFSDTSGGGATLAEVHTAGLVSADANGVPEARLASRIPTLQDGSIAMLPDGRMRTTWELRPNITWHDGRAFIADDVVFSWEVMRHPDLRSGLSGVATRMETVEASDARTVVITWTTPYYRALELGQRSLWPFPRHILGEAFEGDKQGFVSHPHFTAEYVNLGPYRLVDFGLGEQQVFERYDGYLLGRPKVQTIVLRTIADPNAILANLKAGAIDIASEATLPGDTSLQLRDEWRQDGGGAVLGRQLNWGNIAFQFDARWARPIEMSQDVRIRRGLLYGLDREALREVVLPGFPDATGDTFMKQSDPRARIVGRPFSRYPYDPTRAAQELAEAGWRRSGGVLLGTDGRQVQFDAKAPRIYTRELAVIGDAWRQLGAEVNEVIPPASLDRDDEYASTFPGVEASAKGNGDRLLTSLDSRQRALPENRWRGLNTAHYANPELDALVDRIAVSLDLDAQALLLRDAGEILAADLPALPMYFRMGFAAVRSGIRAIDDFPATPEPGGPPGLLSRNAHLWDRQ